MPGNDARRFPFLDPPEHLVEDRPARSFGAKGLLENARDFRIRMALQRALDFVSL
ncbi:MAG: hypothetical protein ABI747_01695 [Candidatus Moraniibacteriota bacterium]